MSYNNTSYPQNSAPRTQQKDDQERSTGPTLYNNKAGKFLNFNYWGRYANIEIGSVQPGTTMTWDVRKNAQKVSQSIPFENLSELWDICEEVIDSLKNTGTFTSSGIRLGMNQDSVVEINNGSTINMAPGIYLVIYKNLDSSNRTNNLEIYPFDNSRIMRGYDHSTGMVKDDFGKVGQFKKFFRMIKEATKAFTMAQAHSVQVLSKNDKLSTFKALSAISTAMGIDISSELSKLSSNRQYKNNGNNKSNQTGYGTPRSSSNWYSSNQPNNPANNQYRAAQQAMATLDDPVDINISMDDLTNVDMIEFN